MCSFHVIIRVERSVRDCYQGELNTSVLMGSALTHLSQRLQNVSGKNLPLQELFGHLGALKIVTGLTFPSLDPELTDFQPPHKKTAEYCTEWASADRFLQLKSLKANFLGKCRVNVCFVLVLNN